MATLKDVFFKGLREANKKDVSVGSFEERQKTVGSSDVGGCIRKAVLSKLNKVEYDEKTLLTFALGHSVEEVLRKSFEANKFKYHYQYRVENGFMVANIDFCLESKKECVIVELKTTSNLPSSPYEEHILQVQYQMALLREEKKKNVRAKIFYIDLATKEIAEFDVSFDESLAKIALERAKKIYEYVLKKEIPDGEEKLYCHKCPFKHNCPTYMKGAINQDIIISAIEEIVRLEEEVKKIQKILKKHEKWRLSYRLIY